MEPLPPEPPKRKLLDQVRDAVRLKHYSDRTEQSDVAWIRRYILFHNKRHPKDMGASEVEAFLTHLTVAEVKALLGAMTGLPQLVAELLYGAGLRLNETLILASSKSL